MVPGTESRLATAGPQQTSVAPAYNALADSRLRRARDEVERVREMVANGTLPRVKLQEAEEKLADAVDEDTLARTLYGSTPVEQMTDEQAKQMQEASQRRVDRQQKIVDRRELLLANGIIARTELENDNAELEARRQVVDLVQTRIRLLDELKRMAESERAAERLTAPGIANMREAMARGAVVRFNGTAPFDLKQLGMLSAQFQKKFAHPLPVSALGETNVHRALGLDHRNRADIALSPDSPEGLWFRLELEKAKLPYLAFRAAVAGAATAPHIHVGPGSTRLMN